jgi:RimJ/RimL family protein N-acetyltransferase
MHLLRLTDAHFAWLMGEAMPPADAPRVAEGGLAPPEIVDLLRGVAVEVGGEAAWMMVVDGEAVGMISIKERDAHGRWDIGYGVAPRREGRGHASAAVAALKDKAKAQGARGLTAETLPDNGPDSGASPRVLRRNGFACIGQFDHPEDGIVDQWVVEW